MKKMMILAGLAIAAGLGTVQAQNEIIASGRVLAGPVYDIGRSVMFSQHDNIYGTSRATAMGGAFTSLGADLSSMSINPAGLGMYQSSDWGITAALTMEGMRTASPNMHPAALSSSGNKTSFGLNNLGIAYNVFNSSDTFTSLTLGFSYNRSANFNSRTSFDTFGEGSTIGEAFSHQINWMLDDGLSMGDLDWDASPWTNHENIYLNEWAAVLGWQTFVVDDLGDGSVGYYTDAIPCDTHFTSVSKGGVYEYNFSGGANIGNFLYLGATVGLNEISYQEDTTYEEYYNGDLVPLGTLWFDQITTIRGSGLTAKLGAVIRPAEALRIGIAFHLPTYYNITKSYQGWMGTAEAESDTSSPLMDNIRFKTAPRLLMGISGVIGGRAVLALDWNVDWNNTIHSRGLSPDRIEASKQNSREKFRPAHTFRAGLEVMPSDFVSLRLGGSWMPDFMKDDFLINDPIIRSSYSVSAGLGFNIGRNGYLDMAYVYNHAKMSDYDLWFYDDGVALAGQWDGSPGAEIDRFYTPTRTRHMVTLTIGSRF